MYCGMHQAQLHCTSRAPGFLFHFPFRCLLNKQSKRQHLWPPLSCPSFNQPNTLPLLLFSAQKQVPPEISQMEVVLLTVNQSFLLDTMALVRTFCLYFLVSSSTRSWPLLCKRSPATLLLYCLQFHIQLHSHLLLLVHHIHW